MKLLYRSVLGFTHLFFRLFHQHRVYGLENFPKGAGIIAPNHTSFFDPPIAAISSPEEVHFLARESLFKNPVFGRLITALNAHPVSGQPGDIVVFKQIIKLLNEGKKVILFPEGTRSSLNLLGPIKPGIGLLLSRTDAALIPTYIHGSYAVWNRHRKFPKLFGKTACVFGPPIYWKDFSHLEKKEAQEAIAQKLYDSINALRAWYETQNSERKTQNCKKRN